MHGVEEAFDAEPVPQRKQPAPGPALDIYEQWVEQQIQQLEPELQVTNTNDTIVIADGLPLVPAEKHEKLLGVLQRVFGVVGPVARIHMPQDSATKESKGFAFVEFEHAEHAAEALVQINGYQLDRAHAFRVNMYEDISKYANASDVYEPPTNIDLEVSENLREWLLDPRGIDQYVLRHGDETEICWNEIAPGSKNEIVASRRFWTETYVAWSPLGTYLATLHKQGVAVWGGASWKKVQKFAHAGVKLIEFSPCENYLVTFSSTFAEHDNPKDPQAIIVWDVRSGNKMRGFPVQGGKEQGSQWPAFRWSHDDRFFARMAADVISVYQTPDMGLLDKKSIKVAGMRDFAWSPSDNIISFFVPESDNNPARVVLMEIPSRREIRQKLLFNVSDVNMHWQTSGDFLCVKVDRHTKSKKSTYTNFELFRMREKNIPVDVIEMKDPIIAFAWEPRGSRCAIIHGDGTRPDVSFYELKKQGAVELIKTLEKRAANSIFWSPRGRFCVLAGLRGMNGQLEFFDAELGEKMGEDEHFMCTSVEWDPSGRFVATVVSSWRYQTETGYNMYSFQGQKLYSLLKDRFYQLLWRPRPPSLLSKEKQKEIEDNLNKYITRYEQLDEEKARVGKGAERARREAVRREFQEFVAIGKRQWAEQRPQRIELRGGAESDNDEDYVVTERLVEETVSEFTEILAD